MFDKNQFNSTLNASRSNSINKDNSSFDLHFHSNFFHQGRTSINRRLTNKTDTKLDLPGTKFSFPGFDEIPIQKAKKIENTGRRGGVNAVWKKDEVKLTLKLDERYEAELEDFVRSPKLNNKDHKNMASLLMYVPQNVKSLSTRNATRPKPFQTFSELAKTKKNDHEQLFEGILRESFVPRNRIQEEEEAPQSDRIKLMKKVLDFNQKQKVQYVEQILAAKNESYLPLLGQKKDKFQKKLQIRILPSKKLMDDNGTAADDSSPTFRKHSNLGFHGFSAPNSPQISPPKKAVTERRKSLTPPNEESPLAFFQTYNVLWNNRIMPESVWKPQVREGHTFTAVGRYIVLYGGLSNVINNQIVVFDPETNLWTKPKVTGEIPRFGRHGHSACEFYKNIIVFGGEQSFNQTLHIRECLNDVQMFNVQKNEWQFIKTHNHQLEPRRYHTAAIQERMMYVYGGINSEGEFLKDLWSLNLKNNTWDKLSIAEEREIGIAFHTMNYCENDKKYNRRANIKEEGFYVFGGKNSQGTILDTLKYFVGGIRKPQWIYPQTKGIPPTARYNHSATFYPPSGLLVIYGGKNDTLYGNRKDICLNDVKILNLEHMVWVTVTNHGSVSSAGRSLHAATVCGSRLLVFGGVEFLNYANDEILSIELSQTKVRKAIEIEKRNSAYYMNSLIDRRLSGAMSSPDGKPHLLIDDDGDDGEEEQAKPKSFLPTPKISLDLRPQKSRSLSKKLTQLK